MFELFFSESLKRHYIDVDFTERFPSLRLAKLLKMPVEIREIEVSSILTCSKSKIEQIYCLKMVGNNESNVELQVTLYFIFERNDWFINFVEFKV